MNLNKDVIEKIFKHALQTYPDECCGIVTGNENTQTVHLCKNIQNKLHAEDPVRYPRDARTAYVIDRSEFDRIISDARDKGEDIIAFYHSHTDHEAYFSGEDHAAQTVFGEPEFPDALHVVVSVMNRKIHDIKCFIWNRDLQHFTAIKDCLNPKGGINHKTF
jgi:proteasome lid subunit RPN8/RPN11